MDKGWRLREYAAWSSSTSTTIVASGCTGGTCVGKVANIIGFFVEGMCNTVTLDAGLACDDPSKDVVGRIVTLPSQHVGGTGGVEDNASFLKVIRLIR